MIKYVNQKAISPVIATALFLIVTVIATVGFQSWFDTYSFTILSNVETDGKNIDNIEIKTLVNNNLYIYSKENNISLNELKIVDDSGNLICKFKETEVENNLIGEWNFEDLQRDDDFNSGVIDANKWFQTIPAGDSIDLDSGQVKLCLNGNGVDKRVTLNQNLNITGDFDIQIDWSSPDLLNSLEVRKIFFLRIGGPNTAGGANYFRVDRDYAITHNRLKVTWRNNGVYNTQYINSNDISGKIRLKRTGSTLQGFYWNSGSWVLLGTLNSGWTIDVTSIHISLSSESGSTDDYCVSFDNFKINKGETLEDDSINNNNGKVEGGTWVSGKFGNALKFDGIDDHIKIPDSNDLDFGNNNFTVSMWVDKHANSVGWLNIWGVNKWNTGGEPGTNEWTLSIGEENSNHPVFSIESGVNKYKIISSKELTLNNWHHVLGVRDGDYIKLYLDGVLENSTFVGSASINNVGRDLYFANSSSSTITTYVSIDEVKIFNRSLSDAEILKLYNSNILSSSGLSVFDKGVNKIDVSSCNLEENTKYNIVGINNNEIEEKYIIK